MAKDTFQVHWRVTQSGATDEHREFVSLPKALRFIRDESALSTAGPGARAHLVTDEETAATFTSHHQGVQISGDAIPLVQDAWTALDDD